MTSACSYTGTDSFRWSSECKCAKCLKAIQLHHSSDASGLVVHDPINITIGDSSTKVGRISGKRVRVAISGEGNHVYISGGRPATAEEVKEVKAMSFTATTATTTTTLTTSSSSVLSSETITTTRNTPTTAQTTTTPEREEAKIDPIPSPTPVSQSSASLTVGIHDSYAIASSSSTSTVVDDLMPGEVRMSRRVIEDGSDKRVAVDVISHGSFRTDQHALAPGEIWGNIRSITGHAMAVNIDANASPAAQAALAHILQGGKRGVAFPRHQ